MKHHKQKTVKLTYEEQREEEKIPFLPIIMGGVALASSFVYWGFIATPEHKVLSQIILGVVSLLNFILLSVYFREIVRRDKAKA